MSLLSLQFQYFNVLSRQRRSALSLFAALVFISLSITGCAAENQSAAIGYRYWGYSQSGQGSDDAQTWITAMQGPATTNPKDGSVEGWNYTFSAEGVVDPSAPATLPNFTTLCEGTAARPGEKRVAYIIEFGDPAIYPKGESAPNASSGCVSLPTGATGLDVLNKVAAVRTDESGVICGINAFPSKDCGADAIAVPESLKK